VRAWHCGMDSSAHLADFGSNDVSALPEGRIVDVVSLVPTLGWRRRATTVSHSVPSRCCLISSGKGGRTSIAASIVPAESSRSRSRRCVLTVLIVIRFRLQKCVKH
jgi:hypothetical protein